MPAGRRKKQTVEVLKEETSANDENLSSSSDTQKLEEIIGNLNSSQEEKSPSPIQNEEINSDNENTYEEEEDEDNEEEPELSNLEEGNGDEFLPQDLMEKLSDDSEDQDEEDPHMEDLANVLSVFFHNSEGENVVDVLTNVKESIDRNSKCLLKLSKIIELGFENMKKNK